MKSIRKHTIPVIALFGAVIGLAACTTSSQPENGLAGQMRRTGKINDEQIKTWENGKRAVAKGEKQIERGETLVVKGESNVQRGQEMIAAGETQSVAQAEAYRRATRRIGGAKTPQLAMDESKTLEDIAEKWQEGLDRQKKGERLVREGEEQIAEGRTLKRNGEAMIAEGNGQMKRIEALHRAAGGLMSTPVPGIADNK